MNQLRLSPSRVNDFSNCPLLYKYRTIDQLPESPSLDAERGTLVHTVLHDLFESPAQSRTIKQATDLLPTRWQEQLAQKPELAELITSEKEWLDRWKEKLDNPIRTPRQVLRSYVADLGISVSNLDAAMEWNCWDTDEDDEED